MSKIILLCGKLCAGKTTYARQLLREEPAVYLSIDELMLALFPEPLGENYDAAAARAQAYLCKKAADLVNAGVSVIFEGEAWRRAGREKTSAFFSKKGILFEWHYIGVSDKMWKQNIAKRNAAVAAGETGAYFVDDGLAEKCRRVFEEPHRDEIDVWFRNDGGV